MEANISVCIFSPSEKIWGGGQLYIERLCNYMNEQGIDTAIATSEPSAFDCQTIEMKSALSKVRRFYSSFSLARFMKRSNISVIVLNGLSSLWLAPIFKISGMQVVSLLHMPLQKKNSAGFGHSVIEYHLLRASSFFCDKVFTVNKSNIEVFPVKVDFVGNFISPWFFNETQTPKKYDLGIIARLVKVKNIPLFIKLVETLNAKSHRDIKALIVGNGDEREYIIECIKAASLESNIDLYDWMDRENLPAIYDSIKCFAVTSHHEGFASTLLESHARGVPAITTRSAGFCAEFIEGFNTVTGLSFIPEEIESVELQESVQALIDNAEQYKNDCIQKAKLFNEDNVLGLISLSIESLLIKKKVQAK